MSASSPRLLSGSRITGSRPLPGRRKILSIHLLRRLLRFSPFLTLICAGPALGADPPRSQTVIAVDAGHGGRDRGAETRKAVEKDIDLAVARRVAKHVAAAEGLASILTRDSDDFISLSERVEKAEKVGARILVSVHVDKVRGRKGVCIYYYGRNRSIPKGPPRHYGEEKLPPPPPAQIEASRKLAVCMDKAFRGAGFKLNPMDRGAFLIFKGKGIPSILVEVGNLTDDVEVKELNQADYQEKIAETITRGLQDFLTSNP